MKPTVGVFSDYETRTVLDGWYVTCEEFARVNGVSLPTARRRAAQYASTGAAVKIGGTWLFRLGDKDMK